MNTVEREAEVYLAKVKSSLLCSEKEKNIIIEDIRSAIYDYIETNNISDIKEIYARFGSPEEIAKAHFSDLDPKEIKKKLSAKRIIIIVAVIIVLAFLVAFAAMFIDAYQNTHGYYVEELANSTLRMILNL